MMKITTNCRVSNFLKCKPLLYRFAKFQTIYYHMLWWGSWATLSLSQFDIVSDLYLRTWSPSHHNGKLYQSYQLPSANCRPQWHSPNAYKLGGSFRELRSWMSVVTGYPLLATSWNRAQVIKEIPCKLWGFEAISVDMDTSYSIKRSHTSPRNYIAVAKPQSPEKDS